MSELSSELLIGCHVSMQQPLLLVGSINEAVSVGANAFMIYTGAPQNTVRISLEKLRIDEFHKKLFSTKFNSANIFVHAPYIINLANLDEQKTNFGVEFLVAEVNRVNAIGLKWIIVHPGSSLKQNRELSIKHVSSCLNTVFDRTKNVVICVETMSGKGTEVGITFQEIRSIIDNINQIHKQRVGVCIDTCHLNDAGYSISELESLISEFDQVIGLNFLKVIHLNDSKNPFNSRKDRHENIGYGSIGFDALCAVCYHPLLQKIPKILETPYFADKAPYQHEIMMLKRKKFFDWREKIVE